MVCTDWSRLRSNPLSKMRVVNALAAFFLLLSLTEINAQKYYGKRIGQLSQLQHSVKGEVYAVDSRTIHIKGFSYDGTAPDAFFYAGRSGNPSDNGVIIPDENGRRDPLGAYNNRDITITLPDGMTLKDIAWLSIWCRAFSIDFGSLAIPRGLEYPRPQKIDGFPTLEHGVKSDKIVVVDAQTFLIPDFHYDGDAPDAFFWVGTGNKPGSNGIAVPDENGGREPIKRYSGKTIVITLPDSMTIFDIDYLGVWCKSFSANFGHVIIPRSLNIPPSLKMLGVAPQTKLNCEVLHDDLAFEVRWAVAGDSIVMQLVGRVDDGEYMSFGLSGSDTKSVMVGGDVTVAWLDQLSGRGEATDYYLDAQSQCQGGKGSCPDEKIRGGRNNVRLLNAAYINDFTMLTFQRPLRGTDSNDKDITPNFEQAVIWAIGPVNSQGDTAYHRLRLRGDMFIDFGRSPFWNCPYPDEQESRTTTSNSRTQSSNSRTPSANSRTSNTRTRTSSSRLPAANTAPSEAAVQPWHIPPIPCYEPEDGVFYAQIGPTGGKSGYNAITGKVGWGISWYINGLLIPEVNVIRGKTYTFVVEGGSDPNVPAQYHPFYITDDPEGGYEHRTEAERDRIQVFAGVEVDTDGYTYPTAYGRLCEWKANPDSPANTFRSFGAYQRTLNLDCQEGQPGILQWTPDALTPDQVYYQCYTHRNLGWKINVVDRCISKGGSNIGASRADYDYYDDDPVTNTTDGDIVTVGGSTRYETKLNSRRKGVKEFVDYHYYDSDPFEDSLTSFDSFPFASNLDDLEISNDILKKPFSKVPLGAPGFEFPELPSFKKASINATGFKTLRAFPRKVPGHYSKKFNSLENENLDISIPKRDSFSENQLQPQLPNRTDNVFEVHWDSKRTSFPQFDFTSNSNIALTRPKDSLYSRQPEESVKVNYKHNYYDDAYLPQEDKEYEDFYDDTGITRFQDIYDAPKRAEFNRPIQHEFSINNPNSLAAKVDVPQASRKPYSSPPLRLKPKTNQVATSHNKVSHKDVVEDKEVRVNVPEYEYPKRVTSLGTSAFSLSQMSPSVVPAIHVSSFKYHTERPTGLTKPNLLYKPGTYLTSPATGKQKNHLAIDNDPKGSLSSVNKYRPTHVFSFQDEDPAIDPKTGLPYAVNEGFDPSTIVFENDFKPVHRKDLSNNLLAFEFSPSHTSDVIREPGLMNPITKPDLLSKYYSEVLQQPPLTIVIPHSKPSFINQREVHDKNKFVHHTKPIRRPFLPAFKMRPPPDDFYKRFARRMLPLSESSVENAAPSEIDTSANLTIVYSKPSIREKRSVHKTNDALSLTASYDSAKSSDDEATSPNFKPFLPRQRGLRNSDRIDHIPLAGRTNNPESRKYFQQKLHPPPAVQKRILPESSKYNKDITGVDNFFQRGYVSERKLTPTQTTHLMILKDIWDNFTNEMSHAW